MRKRDNGYFVMDSVSIFQVSKTRPPVPACVDDDVAVVLKPI